MSDTEELGLLFDLAKNIGIIEAKMDAKDTEIERLREENKRLDGMVGDLNDALLEERLQKTPEYAKTNDQLRERIEELEGQIRHLQDGSDCQDNCELHPQGVFITNEQIDEAWAVAHDPTGRLSIPRQALKELNIVRCEGCGGRGRGWIDNDPNAEGSYEAVCPDCNGNGWVIKVC